MCKIVCIYCVNSTEGEFCHINICARSPFLLLLLLIQEKYAFNELRASVLFCYITFVFFNMININKTGFISIIKYISFISVLLFTELFHMSSQSIAVCRFIHWKNTSSEGIKLISDTDEPDIDYLNQSPWLFTLTSSHYICIGNMEWHKIIKVTKVEHINTNMK